jgi:opacity protein-like surface antigen
MTQQMETEMKRLLTALALVVVLMPAATAQSQTVGAGAYSTYNPATANTSDPESAPLMHDRSPRAFTNDAAARANTADPGSAPLMTDPPVTYRGLSNDPAATANTSDPG